MAKPLKQYSLRIKTPAGRTEREVVVPANSPRSAIEEFCTMNSRAVSALVKYGSWSELRNAHNIQGGVGIPCEVVLMHGDRRNFYILYTK